MVCSGRVSHPKRGEGADKAGLRPCCRLMTNDWECQVIECPQVVIVAKVPFESVIPNTLSSPSRPVCPVTGFGCAADANAVSGQRASLRAADDPTSPADSTVPGSANRTVMPAIQVLLIAARVLPVGSLRNWQDRITLPDHQRTRWWGDRSRLQGRRHQAHALQQEVAGGSSIPSDTSAQGPLFGAVFARRWRLIRLSANKSGRAKAGARRTSRNPISVPYSSRGTRFSITQISAPPKAPRENTMRFPSG